MTTQRAETEKDTIKAVERLVAGFDFRKTLLVAKETPKEYLAGQADAVEIVGYSADKVELKTKTQNGAYLLLTDTFYPGWKASVNGEEKEILRAFGVFRAVEVAPGESRIIMAYRPDSFKIGVIISVVSLAALIFIAIRKTGVE